MLRPETARVWHHLEHQRAPAGFVLVAGSALTLRIGHRLSEDPDFAWTGHKLPRAQLDALCRLSAMNGF